MLACYQNIFQNMTDKLTNCKSTLLENSTKAEMEYKSIFAILFIRLTELICIIYHPDDVEAYVKYCLNAINEALNEDFDISKSYKNIINNIDYIKDALLQQFDEFLS